MTDDTHQTRRRFLGAAVAAGAIGIAGCSAAETGWERGAPEGLFGDGPTARLEPVAEGFGQPTGVAVDEEGRRFVADQVGTVTLLDPDGTNHGVVVDLRDRSLVGDAAAVNGGSGLLGIAVDPTDGRRLALRYSVPPAAADTPAAASVERLATVRLSADRRDLATPEPTVVLDVPQPETGYAAGDVCFGPEGYCYVTTGGGGGGDVTGHDDWADNTGPAQNTQDSLRGGVLRLDLAGDPYDVPADNPLADDSPHRGEYFAWGFRKPWGMAFHEETLYVADVGTSFVESVYAVSAGGNYGWNVREGTHCVGAERSADPGEGCPDGTPDSVRGGEPFREPVIEYPHEYEGRKRGTAIAGGGFVDLGEDSDAIAGYVFADWSQSGPGEADGSLFVASPQADGEVRHKYNTRRDLWQANKLQLRSSDDVTEVNDLNRYVTALAATEDGLYVLTSARMAPSGTTGRLHRLTPTG